MRSGASTGTSSDLLVAWVRWGLAQGRRHVDTDSEDLASVDEVLAALERDRIVRVWLPSPHRWNRGDAPDMVPNVSTH